MSPPPEPILDQLVEHHKKDCNRYTSSFCGTTRCLKRGGWTSRAGVSYEVATCEAHETVLRLAELHRVTTALEEMTAFSKESGIPHQRAWDLLRQMRGHLSDENLIDHHEYAWLAFRRYEPEGPAGQGSPAPRRLERYDEHAARLKAAERDLASFREQVVEMTTVLKRVCDRSWKDETPIQVAHIAANAILHRDDEIKHLREAHAQALREAFEAGSELERRITCRWEWRDLPYDTIDEAFAIYLASRDGGTAG